MVSSQHSWHSPRRCGRRRWCSWRPAGSRGWRWCRWSGWGGSWGSQATWWTCSPAYLYLYLCLYLHLYQVAKPGDDMFTLKNFVYSECIPSLGKYLKMWFNQEESGSWRGGVMNRKLEWIGQALNLNWLIAFLEETTQNIKLFYKFLWRLSEPKKTQIV